MVALEPWRLLGGLCSTLYQRLPDLGRQVSRLAGGERVLNGMQDGRRRQDTHRGDVPEAVELQPEH